MMEPLTETATVLTILEKLRNMYKDWTGKLPDGPTKDQASKDLATADENLQLAKIELAKGLGYRLCQRHFPPGILLDIREDRHARWKCDTCGDITPHNGTTEKTASGESWVRRGGRATYY